MKTVKLSTINEYQDWLNLAKEVEPLFGPMVDKPAFCDGLKNAILERNAFCVYEDRSNEKSRFFHGGIVISREANEIIWFAVAQQSRGRGIGNMLLSEAIKHLNHTKPITVTTFDKTIEAGIPARNLYQSFGFYDSGVTGKNPAGISTATMVLVK